MHGDEEFEYLKDAPKVLTQEEMLKREIMELEKQLRYYHTKYLQLLKEKTNRKILSWRYQW